MKRWPTWTTLPNIGIGSERPIWLSGWTVRSKEEPGQSVLSQMVKGPWCLSAPDFVMLPEQTGEPNVTSTCSTCLNWRRMAFTNRKVPVDLIHYRRHFWICEKLLIQPREVIDQKQMEADSGEVQSKATVKYGMDYRIFLLFALKIVIFKIYAGNYRRKKWKTNYKDM